MEHYNREREHQAIGDVAPIRRIELVERIATEVIDPGAVAEEPRSPGKVIGRRVDRAGRISR